LRELSEKHFYVILPQRNKLKISILLERA